MNEVHLKTGHRDCVKIKHGWKYNISNARHKQVADGAGDVCKCIRCDGCDLIVGKVPANKRNVFSFVSREFSRSRGKINKQRGRRRHHETSEVIRIQLTDSIVRKISKIISKSNACSLSHHADSDMTT